MQIAEHEELIQELGRRFFDLVPLEGWVRVDLWGSPERFEVSVLMEDRSRSVVEGADRVGVILRRLRALVRDPVKGEWRSARITLTAPGLITYNYDFGRTELGVAGRPFGPLEEHSALLDFTTWMVQTLPLEWEQMFLTFRSVGSYVEVPSQIITVFGGSGHLRVPDSVVGFFLDLKGCMYKPAGRVWTSLRYHLTRHDSRYSVWYDWDGEPDWDHLPAVEHFARELELFPRDSARVPAWLRQRVGALP